MSLNSWPKGQQGPRFHTTSRCMDCRVRLFADSGQNTPRFESDFKTGDKLEAFSIGCCVTDRMLHNAVVPLVDSVTR